MLRKLKEAIKIIESHGGAKKLGWRRKFNKMASSVPSAGKGVTSAFKELVGGKDLLKMLKDQPDVIRKQISKNWDLKFLLSPDIRELEGMERIIRERVEEETDKALELIMEAAKYRHMRFIKYLLGHMLRLGVVDEVLKMTDSDGNTLMHLVAQNGEWVDELINRDIFLMLLGPAGKDVMNPQHGTVVKLLGPAEVDVDIVNIYANTPLHLAAQSGQWHIVSLLLGLGADPNARNKDGGTSCTHVWDAR